MAEQILVPLKRNDRVGEIIPYVEQVTQPGMQVVFLVPNPMDRLTNWWRDRRISIEAERRTRLAEGLPSMYPWENRTCVPEERFFPVCEYPWENQRRLCQERLSPVCEPLRKKGCEVSVALYRGSLRKALRSYALNKDVCLIMVRGGIDLWITRFMRRTIPIFGLFKRTECPPMLLLRTDHK